MSSFGVYFLEHFQNPTISEQFSDLSVSKSHTTNVFKSNTTTITSQNTI